MGVDTFAHELVDVDVQAADFTDDIRDHTGGAGHLPARLDG